MATLIERETQALPQAERDKAVKILAKSIYRELRSYGYEPTQVVALASELINLVSQDLRSPDSAR